jgi:flavin-dependent dehydrogenase
MGLLDAVLALDPSRLEGWRLRTPGADVTADFGPGVHGLGVPRELLDHALLSAARDAGASVSEEVRVEHVAPARTGDPRPTVTLRSGGERRTVRPRLVVGADGLRSIVSRSLGLLARGPKRRKVSVTIHVTGSGLPSRHGILDLRNGCTLGVAPVGAQLWNVTVVVDARRDGRRLAGDPLGYVAATVRARFPQAVWTLRGGPWASGPFDWPVRRCWSPGVALVGDAAGYFDPFTGQGIYRALRSAELASEACLEILADADPGVWEPLAAYHRRWTRETRWSRLVQRGVDRVMAHPSLRRPLLRQLHASGGLSQVVQVTGDAASPTTLLRPSVWSGTISQNSRI